MQDLEYVLVSILYVLLQFENFAPWQTDYHKLTILGAVNERLSNSGAK